MLRSLGVFVGVFGLLAFVHAADAPMGSLTGDAARGRMIGSDGRGLTTGAGGYIQGDGLTGVKGLRGSDSDVVRITPAVVPHVSGTRVVSASLRP